MLKTLLLLGVGNAALAVNKAAHGSYETIYGTTRDPERMPGLLERRITPILCDALSPESLGKIREIATGSHVVASFPPDEVSDSLLSEAVSTAAKIVYISSTGVYGGISGIIDETSPVDSESPATAARLRAEGTWQERGAVVLRAPALYDTNYGLHRSLLAGKFRLPGDGTRYSSRIHLDDLATIVLKSLLLAPRGSTYVVGDETPCPQIEVVQWLCDRLRLELPASIPIEQAHITQQGNRQINPRKVLSDLGISLRFSSYRDGFEHCIREYEAAGEAVMEA